MSKSSKKTISEADSPDIAPCNADVERCIRAWNRAYKKARQDDDKSEYEREKAGNKAFLAAMPPLAGRENIRNFIACVALAAVRHMVFQKEVTQLLYAAQVAIGADGRVTRPSKAPSI
jgi:hypothetical protein